VQDDISFSGQPLHDRSVSDVRFDKSEVGASKLGESGYFDCSVVKRIEVINTGHQITTFQQPPAAVTSDEACCPGDQHTFRQMVVLRANRMARERTRRPRAAPDESELAGSGTGFTDGSRTARSRTSTFCSRITRGSAAQRPCNTWLCSCTGWAATLNWWPWYVAARL
jgi:hypothetical protein